VTPLDLIFEALYNVVSWAAEFVPRLPQQWLAFVNRVVADAGSLFAGIPYTGLIPWSTVNAIAVGMPLVLASAFALRLVLRVWAWVRSRGTADQ
jgi:hypothetical protein